jgi:hypothetical protein
MRKAESGKRKAESGKFRNHGWLFFKIGKIVFVLKRMYKYSENVFRKQNCSVQISYLSIYGF